MITFKRHRDCVEIHVGEHFSYSGRKVWEAKDIWISHCGSTQGNKKEMLSADFFSCLDINIYDQDVVEEIREFPKEKWAEKILSYTLSNLSFDGIREIFKVVEEFGIAKGKTEKAVEIRNVLGIRY